MNHTKALMGLVLTAFIAAGCSTPNKPENTGPQNFAKALAKAKASVSNAQKVRFEWKSSKKMLGKAEKTAAKAAEAAAKASKTDDSAAEENLLATSASLYTQAVKMANKAGRQGELAIKQALAAKTAGPL